MPIKVLIIALTASVVCSSGAHADTITTSSPLVDTTPVSSLGMSGAFDTGRLFSSTSPVIFTSTPIYLQLPQREKLRYSSDTVGTSSFGEPTPPTFNPGILPQSNFQPFTPGSTSLSNGTTDYVAPVPEPATLLLFGAGAALAARRRAAARR